MCSVVILLFSILQIISSIFHPFDDQESNDIVFSQIPMNQPTNFPEPIQPGHPQYFTFTVDSGGTPQTSMLTIMIQCPSGCSGIETTISSTLSQAQAFEGIYWWNETSDSSVPTLVIYAESNPPFQPGEYYVALFATDYLEGAIFPQGSSYGCNGIGHDMPTVCSSHGNCTSEDHCVCDHGYSQKWCEYWTCDGIDRYDKKDVCSGHGDCVGYEDCHCDSSEYHGKYCGVWKCFGIWNNSTHVRVCSGNGKCTAADYCKCFDSFTGNLCTEYTCYGVSWRSPQVCSGHGNCTYPDECICEKYYQTDHYKCSKWTCFGVNNDYYEKVCSSHGTCSGYNHCTCRPGYEGHACALTFCFGVQNDTKSVCSSHGECVSGDDCLCTGDYEGVNCESKKSKNKKNNLGVIWGSVGGGTLFLFIILMFCCSIFCCCSCLGMGVVCGGAALCGGSGLGFGAISTCLTACCSYLGLKDVPLIGEISGSINDYDSDDMKAPELYF